ncbi:MAG TPA: hypothetical protein VEV38_13025 [Candidatus Eremiobacteraceae bacterium]|nr:hypothetical protein [Candidatus Eremiobacteraceae bacterium]
MSPGMYEFDLSRFAPVVTDADAYSVDATQRYLLPIYVPPAPSATPAFRAGQRFIEFSQPTGQAQTSAPGLHILTLKSIGHGSSGVTTLVFASDDGTASSVDTQSADVFGLSGLTPIVDDADVDSLVKRYAGRDVYPIADFWPICVFANGSEGEGIRPDPTSPLRIRSIVRLYGVGASWGLGPNILRMLDSGADYVTAGPVLVTFDIGRMDRSLVNHAFASYGGCAAFYSEFSGTWDLERALSFTSTIASHPEWSPPIVSEVKQHQVTVGMTRAMVIASVGYPSVYGTAAQMMKLDTWYYEMPPPASYTVYFKNDIVVKYDPPRMLP